MLYLVILVVLVAFGSTLYTGGLVKIIKKKGNVMPYIREIIDSRHATRENISSDNTPIIIDEVRTVGEPVLEERPCGCGGTLKYGQFSYNTFLNFDKRDLEVHKIWAHGCDNCGTVVAFHPAVARELEWHIDKARNSLSTQKKLWGLIKRY